MHKIWGFDGRDEFWNLRRFGGVLMRHEEDFNEGDTKSAPRQVWQRPVLKRLATPDADFNESTGGDDFSQVS